MSYSASKYNTGGRKKSVIRKLNMNTRPKTHDCKLEFKTGPKVEKYCDQVISMITGFESGEIVINVA